MSEGRTTLLIVGAIAVVCALALVSAGGFILWANANFKNDAGYYSTDILPLKILVETRGGSWAEVPITVGLWIPWLFGLGVALVVGGIVLVPLGAFAITRALRRSDESRGLP